MNIGNLIKIEQSLRLEVPKGKLAKKRIGMLISQIETQIDVLRHGIGMEKNTSDIAKISHAIEYLQNVKRVIQGIIPAREEALREFIFR